MKTSELCLINMNIYVVATWILNTLNAKTMTFMSLLFMVIYLGLFIWYQIKGE